LHVFGAPIFAMWASSFVCLLGNVAGHGNLVWPLSRNNKDCKVTSDPGFPGSFGDGINWYQHFCGTDMSACDPSMGDGAGGQTDRYPGSDPGLAPMLHPCSAWYLDQHHFAPFTGGSDCGSTVWKVGDTVEVISAINEQKHGYYQYRLCPLFNNDYTGMKEADCEKNVVEFASDQIGEKPQFVGKTVPGPPPTRNITATDRAGSKDGTMWRSVDTFQADGSIYVDQLRVPDLPDGKYVLQWRWDCKTLAQISSSCADITLWSGQPSPSPAPKPTPRGHCHAISPVVTDDWCKTNCLSNPPNCPASLCSCEGVV